MPAASYLHIRSGEDSPVRVLPLHGTRARVGRGAQCEIQLDDPTIDEVALVLRRRGTAWHAHAAEPGGVLTIDGSEALGQRRIAQGSTLSVGPFQIALRYELAPEFDESDTEPEAVETSADSTSAEDESSEIRRAERLEEWQASLERRERWLLARKERLKWERRWRDAGERHRSRAVPLSPASSAPPVAKARMPQPPIERETPPLRTIPIPQNRHIPPTEPAPSAPRSPIARTQEPPRREPSPELVVPATELLGRPEESRKLGSVTRVEATDSKPIAPVEEPIGPVEESTAPVESNPVEPTRVEPTPVVSELIDPEALAARWAWEMSNPPPRIKIAFTESRTRPRRMPSPAAEPEIAPPADPQPVRSSPLALPGQVEPAKGTPESPAEALVPALEPAEAPAESAEILWPSVAEILQAHKASEDLSQTVGLRNPGDQRLTEDREPVAWSVSALWVVPPALPMVLLILFGGIALNWTWSQDDRAAGQAANRLLSNSDVPSTGVALEPLPRETWWGSTADHLYLHAAAQGRIEDDPARAENSQFYLNLARGASPVHPGVLDAQNRVFRAQGRAGEVGLVSQDIVALARQAGRRLKAGDRTRALDEYRKALELAARSDPSQAQPAQEDTEGQSRRYLLPNEDLYLSVLHELATEGGDRFADWSAAVPEYAPILISAYRAAHRLGRGDAEQALEKAVQIRVPPAGCSEAEHFAGQAEALALLGRWEESVERYRDAIRLSPIQDHRRTYWLNLAEIHGRQGDLTNRRAALERAWNADREEPESDPEARNPLAIPGAERASKNQSQNQ